MAAGSLLVTEAGGLVGNFTGEADYLDQQECIAGAPRVYGQLVGMLGKYSKFASAGDKAAVRQSAASTLSQAAPQATTAATTADTTPATTLAATPAAPPETATNAPPSAASDAPYAASDAPF